MKVLVQPQQISTDAIFAFFYNSVLVLQKVELSLAWLGFAAAK